MAFSMTGNNFTRAITRLHLSHVRHSSSLASRIEKHNKTLPRLPIPTLEETCTRFLSRTAPLLSPKEQQHTTELVRQFLTNEAPKLQAALIEYEKTQPGSYIERWWDDAYLIPRCSIMIHVNPFFAFEHDLPATSQASRAARVMRATAAFQQHLHSNSFEFDRERDTNLCMLQYTRLLNTSRIPVKGRDTLKTAPNSRHFVVISNQHFFRVDVMVDGKLVPEKALTDQIDHILKSSKNMKAPVVPMGVFTAADRDVWAEARTIFEGASAQNSEMLREIDTAMGVVALDRDRTAGTREALSRTLLHGDPRSRWFDKVIQFIVTPEETGLNFEHSGVDGRTMLTFAHHINQFLHNKGHIPHDATTAVPATKCLSSHVTYPESLHLPARRAIGHAFDLIRQLDTQVLDFGVFGKEELKGVNISPDGFVQMAFQLAYYRMYGSFVSCYESSLTKQFKHGRTEAIRSTSMQAKAFAELFDSVSADRGSKVQAIRDAVKAHNVYSNDCKNGKGVDRHFYALYMMARELEQPVPHLFEDAGWKRLTHSVLSTSNCGTDDFHLFGFGPVAQDGFGIGYMIKNHNMHFDVTSFHRQTEEFKEAVAVSMNDMYHMLKKN
eukprot:TRINITY_DN941_c0_g1::TRINITY_DN941_c0_g1_i1::g.16077::m.16077 TRINITY_DN941_c0_g1::TRINITY_DN941_c0_g1_i1::g.16077  ORF type:complete len:620 (-),score=182.66,sp/P80235/CACM_YEAST/32.77/5e-89,Carn_acyltransf/PF00755.15/3.4e-150 TRINITY_DN941_c0_g1_i1:397-2223(-)